MLRNRRTPAARPGARVLALAALLPVASVVTFAGPASAFQLKLPVKVPGVLSPDEAERELRSMNSEIESALRGLPSQYGRWPKNEIEAIERQEKVVASIEKRLSPTHRVAMSAYSVVEDNLKLLKGMIVKARAAHGCSVARQVLVEKTERDEIPSKDEFVRLFKANEALKQKLDGKGDYEPIARFFDDELARLKGEVPKIKDRLAARKQKEAEKQRSAEVNAAGRRANAALAALQKTVKAKQPIEDAALQELKDSLDELEALSPGTSSYYESELDHFARYQLWQRPDDKAAKAIAASVGGKLAGKGRSKGKKLDVAVKAKKDHCYFLFTRFADEVGTEKVESFTWEQKGTQPQLFANRWGTQHGVLPTEGFCATKDGKVTASADLTFAGSKNGVRYALVEVKRKSFPMAMAGQLALSFGDRCDFGYWKTMWTNPVPGTFAYQGEEPVLITYADEVGGNRYASFMRLSGGDGRAYKDRFSTRAPDAVAVKTQFGGWSCPSGEHAVSKHARAIDRCFEGIEKKYEKKWNKVKHMRARAAELGGISPAAEELAQQVADDATKDMEKKCRPLEEKMKKEAEATFDDLVDALTQKRYQDPLARVEHLAREEEAPFRRW